MMERKLVLALALGVALAATGAWAEGPAFGRTDGPEGSEIGQGGYAWYRTPGQYYVEGLLGAATVDIEPENEALPKTDTTDMLAGLTVGYMTEDWLSFQVGFARILADDPTDLFSAGIRNSMNLEPFNYYFSLDAGLYSPSEGDTRFALTPGVGAEAVLSDHLHVGLQFQRDFVFADDTIAISRFTARVRYKF